jgi:hypothetical protein
MGERIGRMETNFFMGFNGAFQKKIQKKKSVSIRAIRSAIVSAFPKPQLL